MIANARLSARPAAGYKKIGGFMRDMLRRITLIAAQNQEDGDRFIELGLALAAGRNRQPEVRYLRHPGTGRPRRYAAPPMGAAPPGVDRYQHP